MGEIYSLTKKQRIYLTDLLNKQVTDINIPYKFEIIELQSKFNLYPRKERWGCPVCGKMFIVTVLRNGKILPSLFCSKKCSKMDNSVMKLPDPVYCCKCKRKFGKKTKEWFMLVDYKKKGKSAVCYKCGSKSLKNYIPRR